MVKGVRTIRTKPIVTTRHPLHGCGFVTGHDLVTRTRTRDPSRGISHGLSQPMPFPSYEYGVSSKKSVHFVKRKLETIIFLL
jgi:hypothetical protein